jgi:glycosyltransferase involved in cell wall biosynthesis
MKVLHITNNFPTLNHPIFGIFVKEQIDSLQVLGVENTVFFINSREKGVAEYIICYFRLINHLLKHKYDLIHCHHSFSAVVYLATLFPLFNKSIVSFQNDPSKEFNGKLFKIINLFFNKIILKNNSEIYMKYKKSIYFPNGVNLNFFRPIERNKCIEVTKLNKHKKYILFLDSYNSRTQKRLDRFQEVIKILKEKYNLLDIEPLVLTNTKRELMPYYMNVSNLHLLSSDFEGSPNSVKECLACNIPIVSTPVGNVDDLMGDIEGCYISKSFDAEELAQLVILSLKFNNFKGREKLIDKKLDINSVSISLFSIYNSLFKKQ